jgi:hypothetical protein
MAALHSCFTNELRSKGRGGLAKDTERIQSRMEMRDESLSLLTGGTDSKNQQTRPRTHSREVSGISGWHQLSSFFLVHHGQKTASTCSLHCLFCLACDSFSRASPHLTLPFWVISHQKSIQFRELYYFSRSNDKLVDLVVTSPRTFRSHKLHKKLKKKKVKRPGVVAHTCNPATRELKIMRTVS